MKTKFGPMRSMFFFIKVYLCMSLSNIYVYISKEDILKES